MSRRVKLTEEQRENLKKWCAALRSGKYGQGQGRLRDPYVGAYCCLGVACEVFGQGEWEDSEYRVSGKNRLEAGKISLLDLPSVQKHFGFPHDTGFVIPAELITEVMGPPRHECPEEGVPEPVFLTDLNDGTTSYGYVSFTQIADLVEAYVESLAEGEA